VRRRRARRRTEPLDDYLPTFDPRGRHATDPGDRAARADEVLDRERLARAVRQALDRLAEPYRTAFVLRDLDDMPTKEVAAVLRIAPAAVRQRVHRARMMLRGYLAHLVEGGKP
jgi:RNA polymerase sigma-70 factor (ECF subfamily)